jgi:hypothetical protein
MRLFDKLVGYERKLVIMLTCGVAYPVQEGGRYKYHDVYSRAGDFMGKVATSEINNFVARMRREFKIERDSDPIWQLDVPHRVSGLPPIVFDPGRFGLTSFEVIKMMHDFWEFETYPDARADLSFSWREPDMMWAKSDKKADAYVWIEPFSGAYN